MDLIRRFFRTLLGRKATPSPDQPLPEGAAPAENTDSPPKTATQRREEIESFVRNIVSRIEGAAAMGMTTPDAIAAYFNETGITTRKGRNWTGETVAKFLSSPGATRYRSKFKREWQHDIK